MLKLFSHNRKKLSEFLNYEELATYINSNTLLNETNVGETSFWSFVHHPQEDLKRNCALKRPEYITLSESKALENNYGLIEIRRGSCAPLRQVVVTPDLDVGGFQKDWCLEFCRSRKLLVTEVGVRQFALRALISSWNSSSSLPSTARVLQNNQRTKMELFPANFPKSNCVKRLEDPNQKIRLVASQPLEQDGGFQ